MSDTPKGWRSMVVNWKSEDHLKLANIYMEAEDNISCFDGCKEMAFDLMTNEPKEAERLLKDEQ